MCTRWMAAFAALAVLVLGSPPVAADSVESELGEMQQRLQDLEVRLQAASEELESSNQLAADQQALIENSGIDGLGASSGMASFLDTLEFGGWVNASYWYNTNDPDNDNLAGINRGTFGHANFFNPDSNAFTFDQLWFSLERPVDASARAGFAADLLIGEDADIIEGGSGNKNSRSGDNSDWYVHQAYAQYLADFGNGVHVKAGKFATLIGYEVIQAPYNDQISRGIVWQNLQPVDHVGLLVSTQRMGWEAAVGLANGFSPIDRENNDGKTVLGRIGYSGEGYSVMLNGIWGPETFGDESDKLGVGDLIVTLSPNDDLSLWANGSFLRASPSPLATSRGDDRHAWGVAVGGRLAVTERTGFSVRGEYLQDDGALVTGTLGPGPNDVQDVTLWSVTGTVDHKLTSNLIVRGEVRWDQGRIDHVEDNLFADDSTSSFNFDDDGQILVGVDITYLFN